MASEFALNAIKKSIQRYQGQDNPALYEWANALDVELAEVREVLDDLLRNADNGLMPSQVTYERARALYDKLKVKG